MMNSLAGQPPAAAIRARGLRVVRSGRTVLHDLDVDVPRGSVTGLLGPSGCGKTTLLRSVVGVQKIAAGTVTVLGEPAGSSPLRARVGYVTQAPSVYTDLSVAENLRYFADILGAPRTDPARVTELVGLTGQAEATVSRLSGGQRARVSLAAALLGAPELLVLDEPTVGLDPVLRQDLWRLFHQLADAGTTLLVSSHVMDEAIRCTRLLLMREGRLLANDTPTALLAATGTTDIEAAFLNLVTDAAAADPSAADPSATDAAASDTARTEAAR
ncbi:ABC-2 type transport system ATP-binding protein [Streptacidiphilus sp. MAP12-16]|uniref:ABC transporter ATP-binding protein n=1 Tax=Streptacidiphilus sp. MAP12-16 TaxID=3156300 RepID=UPI003513DE19